MPCGWRGTAALHQASTQAAMHPLRRRSMRAWNWSRSRRPMPRPARTRRQAPACPRYPRAVHVEDAPTPTRHRSSRTRMTRHQAPRPASRNQRAAPPRSCPRSPCCMRTRTRTRHGACPPEAAAARSRQANRRAAVECRRTATSARASAAPRCIPPTRRRSRVRCVSRFAPPLLHRPVPPRTPRSRSTSTHWLVEILRMNRSRAHSAAVRAHMTRRAHGCPNAW